MRFSNDNTLSLYDHYIDDDAINPDLIIRIGQKPVSKKLCKKENIIGVIIKSAINNNNINIYFIFISN